MPGARKTNGSFCFGDKVFFLIIFFVASPNREANTLKGTVQPCPDINLLVPGSILSVWYNKLPDRIHLVSSFFVRGKG